MIECDDYSSDKSGVLVGEERKKSCWGGELEDMQRMWSTKRRRRANIKMVR